MQQFSLYFLDFLDVLFGEFSGLLQGAYGFGLLG